MEGYSTNPSLRCQDDIVNQLSHSGGRFWPVTEDEQTGPSLVTALPQPPEGAMGFGLASHLPPSHPPTTFKNGNTRVAGMTLDQEDPVMARRVQKAYDSFCNRIKKKEKEEKLKAELEHITSETENLEREKRRLMENISILQEIKGRYGLNPQDFQVLWSLLQNNGFR